MTISEMHGYFDLLIDKVGTSYFTAAEKDNFINAAHTEYIKGVLPSNEGGVLNVEFSQLVASNIHPLFYETAALNMGAGATITKSAVQSALNIASSSTDPLMYVLNVSWTKGADTYPVRYTRHNEWYEFGANRFKRGSETQPRYKFDATTFTFSPLDQAASIKFTLLKTPRKVQLFPAISSEMPDDTHKAIVEIAVKLAVFALREGQQTKE